MQKCDACEKLSIGYYDLTITGIGDFLFYCAEHETVICAKGLAIDKKRREEYLDRKEWHDNRAVPNLIGDEL